mmetsp:Transcript_2442/g.3557  ORF Transcript_2442/g.3557 Transcript_2442/m.3557 type:complete len:103 (+) Transcript_2442:117-425(+)
MMSKEHHRDVWILPSSQIPNRMIIGSKPFNTLHVESEVYGSNSRLFDNVNPLVSKLTLGKGERHCASILDLMLLSWMFRVMREEGAEEISEVERMAACDDDV